MTALLAIICVVLIAVIAVQVGKVTELAGKIRGEEEVQAQTNRLNGSIGMIFMVVFLIATVVSSFYYKNWMLGYGPHESASEHGASLDYLFNITLFFTGIVFVITQILLFYFAWKYQGKKDRKALFMPHDNKLEIIWTIIPLVTVFAIAAYTMNVNMKLQTLGPKHKYAIGSDPTTLVSVDPSADIGPIDVIARQWSWEFVYPSGVRSSELHLPIDQRVNLRLISEDVLHSFYVPAFRLKQDIIPGSIISYSLTPTKEGRFRLRDAMFSGAYFSQNQTDVIVESEQTYDGWLKATAKQPLRPGLDPGRPLYDRRLSRGDKGWATVPPAPAPMVNDPGDPSLPHDA